MTLDLTQYSEYIYNVYHDTPTTKEIARTVNWTKEEDYASYNHIFRLIGNAQYGQKWCGTTFKFIDSYTFCEGRDPIPANTDAFDNIAYNEGFFIRNLSIEFIFDPLFSTLSNPNWLDFRMKLVMFPTVISTAIRGGPDGGDSSVARTENAYQELLAPAIPSLGVNCLLAESKPITLRNKLCRTRIFLPDVQFIPRGYDIRIIYSCVERGTNQQNSDFNYNMTRYATCEFYGAGQEGKTYLRN